MGLNVFTLFVGCGLGSLVFGEILRLRLEMALVLFAVIELLLALMSLHSFRREQTGVVHVT